MNLDIKKADSPFSPGNSSVASSRSEGRPKVLSPGEQPGAAVGEFSDQEVLSVKSPVVEELKNEDAKSKKQVILLFIEGCLKHQVCFFSSSIVD